ncbi:hypothetical protein M2272_005854 [Mycobacterium frederiksbergense]|uniref:HK97 gp10 family phage protein n=1 Tax=Mycolicibacterium frederiksbergense TaxID=117567 RepID=A0ABT6L9A8_9MYCO|nr:HK97 gp10 family phage protein [Mycolicibacterium frederiksbergense]MDH6199186.1 hypothetical protein [Mycolicibacterium frederiksbergense]
MAKKNALVALGVSQAALDEELRDSVAVKAEKKRVAMQMAGWAKSISPVDHGDYAAAWKVEQGKGADDRTRIVNDNFKANWIEDGTGGDTPTPEYAVAARTAIEFGGTARDVINRPRR